MPMDTRSFLLLALLTGAVSLNGQQRVAVNGRELYLDCEGGGDGPTVILLAGGGGTTGTWDKVQPAVSAFAKVCSYDRAGLGRSDSINGRQSAEEIVNDLSMLLKNARIQPPYVLVGHSIGGLYARKFDEQHDAEVAAMVLVDSSHEEQIWRFAGDEPAALSEYPNWKNSSEMEAEGFLASGKLLQWQFRKPLIVIEHGIPPEPVWHAMQLDLAGRSPGGRLITATNSGHYIQKMEPELVIQSIREVLSEARRGTAPTVS